MCHDPLTSLEKTRVWSVAPDTTWGATRSLILPDLWPSRNVWTGHLINNQADERERSIAMVSESSQSLATTLSTSLPWAASFVMLVSPLMSSGPCYIEINGSGEAAVSVKRRLEKGKRHD